MKPLFNALKDRLWNEPVFFLTLLSILGVVLNDEVPLPAWTQALALGLFGFATRAVVTGPKTAERSAR